MKKILIVLAGYLIASGAVVASFDCDKAHGNIEKMIENIRDSDKLLTYY